MPDRIWRNENLYWYATERSLSEKTTSFIRILRKFPGCRDGVARAKGDWAVGRLKRPSCIEITQKT